jgi:hypothetical protein
VLHISQEGGHTFGGGAPLVRSIKTISGGGDDPCA